MVNISEQDITVVLRQRLQYQAVYHLQGQSISALVVKRFRDAGMWSSPDTTEATEKLIALLTNVGHPNRLKIPDGPLLVEVEKNQRVIIEVAEHLVSDNHELRTAAAQHFLGTDSTQSTWASPYVLDLLRSSRDRLMSDDEPTWSSTALLLVDAIKHDFRINCAGVTQTSWLQYDDSYQSYMDRVFFPRAKSFEHDRPPIVDMQVEQEKITSAISEWSSFDDLHEALDHYLSFCGYLPLAGNLSAGSLLTSWKDKIRTLRFGKQHGTGQERTHRFLRNTTSPKLFSSIQSSSQSLMNRSSLMPSCVRSERQNATQII